MVDGDAPLEDATPAAEGQARAVLQKNGASAPKTHLSA